MKRTLFLSILGVVAMSLGCGNGPPADGDGDGDADGDGDCDAGTWEVQPPEEPALPDEPELPAEPELVSWECPDGWVSVEHDEVLDVDGEPFSWCEPPPIPRLRS